MTSDGWVAVWQFSLLDYHHYHVFHDKLLIGMLVLNTTDRSTWSQSYHDEHATALGQLPTGYAACLKWVRAHESHDSP